MKLDTLLLPLGAFLFLACLRLPASAPYAKPITDLPTALPLSRGVDQALRIPVTPAAMLAVWVIEPQAGTPLRGTVIFLHGFGTNHRSVENAGEALRQAGYRSVLVDMRGFGESTGVHGDFGVTDALDLKQLVDALQKRDLCGRTVGVYGTSLGAATAILFAAADPRVTSVVAVAPFADIRTEVPSFARGVLGTLGTLGTLVPDEKLVRVADAVGTMAHWNLDNAKPIVAIQETRAPVLLIHGDADEFIPHAASEQLHAAAPDHSTLVTPHARGHVDLCFDIPGELQGMTRDWFDRTLLPHDGGIP